MLVKFSSALLDFFYLLTLISLMENLHCFCYYYVYKFIIGNVAHELRSWKQVIKFPEDIFEDMALCAVLS